MAFQTLEQPELSGFHVREIGNSITFILVKRVQRKGDKSHFYIVRLVEPTKITHGDPDEATNMRNTVKAKRGELVGLSHHFSYDGALDAPKADQYVWRITPSGRGKALKKGQQAPWEFTIEFDTEGMDDLPF